MQGLEAYVLYIDDMCLENERDPVVLARLMARRGAQMAVLRKERARVNLLMDRILGTAVKERRVFKWAWHTMADITAASETVLSRAGRANRSMLASVNLRPTPAGVMFTNILTRSIVGFLVYRGKVPGDIWPQLGPCFGSFFFWLYNLQLLIRLWQGHRASKQQLGWPS